jgi:hypothetical protein
LLAARCFSLATRSSATSRTCKLVAMAASPGSDLLFIPHPRGRDNSSGSAKFLYVERRV